MAGPNAAGAAPTLVLSCRPMPAFPRSKRLVAGHARVRLASGMQVHLIPFINITPLKQLMLGMLVFVGLLRWGWKTRAARTRIVYTYNLTVPPALFTLIAAW